jgi:hypothetical protein
MSKEHLVELLLDVVGGVIYFCLGLVLASSEVDDGENYKGRSHIELEERGVMFKLYK